MSSTSYYFANEIKVAQKEKVVGDPWSAELLYFLTDHLGSTSVVVDEIGNVLQRSGYAPYGELMYLVDGSWNAIVDSLTIYMYTGQEFDGDDVDYYGARYYDPVLGRFLQADTILDGMNRYAYCGNNPVRYVDPTGNTGIDFGGGYVPQGYVAPKTPLPDFDVVGRGPNSSSGKMDGNDNVKPENMNILESSGRRLNWLPDNGEPGGTIWNEPGTTGRKYGPDGFPEQDYNDGHEGNPPPEDEPHVHDWDPRPPEAAKPGKGKRQPGRALTPEEQDEWGQSKPNPTQARNNVGPEAATTVVKISIAVKALQLVLKYIDKKLGQAVVIIIPNNVLEIYGPRDPNEGI